MKKGRILRWLLPMLFFVAVTVQVGAQEREEAIFSFSVSKQSKECVVYISNDTLFVPLFEFLDFVKIYYQVNESGVYSGYVNQRDSSFVLDFDNNQYQTISGKTKSIPKGSWYFDNAVYYVCTSLLDSCFSMRLQPNFGQLAMTILAPYELPLFRALRAEYVSNNFRRSLTNDSLGPLVYDRSFKILNGGTFDYNFGVSSFKEAQAYSGGGTLGMEFLGGETQYTFSMSKTDISKLIYRENYRWRYILDGDYINSISLGNLFNSTIRGGGARGYRKQSYQLKGLGLSNENEQTPVGFSTFVIEERIDPNWNVELIVDNQLYEAKKTDPTGYYRFDLPIAYGSTKLIVKKYGPKGEYTESDKSINVSNEFLPPGKLYYNANLGQEKMSKKWMFDGAFTMGVFDWLTSSFSGDKKEGESDYTLINNMNLNLFSQFGVRLMTSNIGVYEAAIRLPQSILGNCDVVFTSYDQQKNKNSSALNSIQVYTNTSRIFELPISISMNGFRTVMKTGSNNSLGININGYLHAVSINGRYNMTIMEVNHKYGQANGSLSGDCSYSFKDYEGVASIFNDTRVQGSTSYIPNTGKFTNFGFSINKNFSRNLYMTFSYSYYVPNRTSQCSFSLNFNSDYIRSTSNSSVIEGTSPNYSTNASGSVEFDPTYMRFRMLSTLGSNSNYGRSSAAVRFYVDKNSNGKYDKDVDTPISEADIYVTNEMTTKISESDGKLLTNLIPGRRYNIRVIPESFTNPALIPEHMELSFIAEPFTCKPIDIICQPGGMVEGNVKYKSAAGEKGQGGVKVRVRSKTGGFETSIAVFSDGSYFYLGVPVGEYEVFVDSMQLAVLRCNSTPAKIDLTVKPTPDGDYIGNLNFTLTPRESGAPRAGDEPLADASVGAKSLRSASGSPLQSVGQPAGKPAPAVTNDTLPQLPSQQQTLTKKIDKGYLFERVKAFSGQKRGEFKPNSDLKAYLESLAEYMATNKNCTVSIIGHTDSFGSFAQNTEDAKGRSQAAAEYLISKGIAKTRIYSSSKGALAPVDTNDTEEGRAKNRRVEIQVLK